MPDSHPALLWGSGVTRRRWLTLGGVGVITLILAFPLQDVIRKTVIIPLAYLWWALGVLYHSIPQIVVWILLIILISLVFMGSFASDRKRTRREDLKPVAPIGQIEGLSSHAEVLITNGRSPIGSVAWREISSSSAGTGPIPET